MARGTGKTTRMIEAAIADVVDGKNVIVLAGSLLHVDQLFRLAVKKSERFSRIIDQTGKSIRFPLADLRFDTIRQNEFMPEEMIIRGYRTTITRVDHFAIESIYAKLLEELHRYDN